MLHYRAPGDMPLYDRTHDTHLRGYFRERSGPSAEILLSGDRTTGHLACIEYKKAVRFDKQRHWRNITPKSQMTPHPRYASQSCPDCAAGCFCRCPIYDSVRDQHSHVSSPYSRDNMPTSEGQAHFLKLTKQIFSPTGATGARPHSVGSRAPLGTAIVFAGRCAARVSPQALLHRDCSDSVTAASLRARASVRWWPRDFSFQEAAEGHQKPSWKC